MIDRLTNGLLTGRPMGAILDPRVLNIVRGASNRARAAGVPVRMTAAEAAEIRNAAEASKRERRAAQNALAARHAALFAETRAVVNAVPDDAEVRCQLDRLRDDFLRGEAERNERPRAMSQEGWWYHVVDRPANDSKQVFAEEIARNAADSLGVAQPASIQWLRPLTPTQAEDGIRAGAMDYLQQAPFAVNGRAFTEERRIFINDDLTDADQIVATVNHEVFHVARPDAPESHALDYGNTAAATLRDAMAGREDGTIMYHGERLDPAMPGHSGSERAYRNRYGHVLWIAASDWESA